MDSRLVREFGSELSACGRSWGAGVDFSGSSAIQKYTGNESWFETAVAGVIGMHGNEPGKGPSVVITDIENSGIEMLWTNGLVGCMCIAIIGRDKSGKLDAFFCHARQYNAKDAVKNPDNPMCLAKEFIDAHRDVRVFWGTDFNYGVRDFSGPAKKDAAQKLLSRELGCWVRSSDCIVARELVFLPKLGLLKDGNPSEVYAWVRVEDLKARSEFSMSKVLSKFEPDAALLKKLEDHLKVIKDDRSSYIRFYFHDVRRSNKILVLEQIVDAYKVGNLDLLRYFAKSAQDKSSPFRDESAINVWSAMSESVTAKLVIEAYDDTVRKISSMGVNGCGLRSDGNDIYSFSEYKEITRASRSETAKI